MSSTDQDTKHSQAIAAWSAACSQDATVDSFISVLGLAGSGEDTDEVRAAFSRRFDEADGFGKLEWAVGHAQSNSIGK